MMKRMALVIVFVVVAAVGIGYGTHPEEFSRGAALAMRAAARAWDGVAANPAPALLAAGTFLLTVVYHKLRGKSLRESVEVAATRVTVVPVPPAPREPENPVVTRAKARATRAQLLADQIGLQNRQRKLPEAILKAEREVGHAQQAVVDAERVRTDRRKAHAEAVARLEELRKEKKEAEAELAAIDTELKKLAILV